MDVRRRLPRDEAHTQALQNAVHDVELRFERVLLEDIIVPNRGVRRHSERQLSMLMASITRFGFIAPILIDSRNRIVHGIARSIAARRLGMRDIPVVRIDGRSEGELAAYGYADNRLAELADWDDETVRDIVLSLPDLDIDIEAVGLEIAEQDIILASDEEVEEDVAPVEPAANPIVRLGDLFTIGLHGILCGDALNEEDCARLMDGTLADMSFNDPPYNVKINGHVSSTKRHREFAMGSGEMPDPKFEEFLGGYLARAVQHTRPGAIVMSAMDAKGLGKLLNAAERANLELLTICVWAKTNAGMGSFYRSQCEFFTVHRHVGAPHLNNVALGRYGRYRTTLWEYAGANSFSRTRMDDLKIHPTVKSQALVEGAIKDCTKRGSDIVLDLFGGSGTTMFAAQCCGRVARLMEIDPGYVEASLRRFETRFGIEAIHVETGMTLSELAADRSGEPQQPAREPPADQQPRRARMRRRG